MFTRYPYDVLTGVFVSKFIISNNGVSSIQKLFRMEVLVFVRGLNLAACKRDTTVCFTFLLSFNISLRCQQVFNLVVPVSCKPSHYRTINVAYIISETTVNICNKIVKSVKRVWPDFMVFFFFSLKTSKATVNFLVRQTRTQSLILCLWGGRSLNTKVF